MPTRAPDLDFQSTTTQRVRRALPTPTLLGFAVAVLAIALIAAVSYGALNQSLQAAERVAHTLEVIERLQVQLSAMKDAETGQRGFLLTGDEPYLSPYRTAEASQQPRTRRLQELLADDAQQRERLETLANLSTAKFNELQHTIELYRSGQSEAALALVRTDEGKTSMERIRALVDTMLRAEQMRLGNRQAELQRTTQFSAELSIGGAALLLVLTLLAAAVASREYRLRDDEQWVRASHNELAQQLQGEMRLPVLAERVLSFLARKLRAQVGALYTVELDGSLQRVGAMALSDAGRPTLAPGEGLPGQTARDAMARHITDVPEGYLTVASAVGRATPRELALAPARHDGAVQAVIELGFLHRMDPAGMALLERVSALLAVTVRAARDRGELVRLLEESQRQAEELQSQQEELRVSNEELEQQSRVQRETQVELEMQQTELERVNSQLSLHSQTLEQQKRQLLSSQAELQANAQALEAASRYKSEFLANMSHELRTPLNSSLILSRLLFDNQPGTLTDEQVRYARAIHDANNDLLALINDILDLSKIEAGHADLHAEPVPLPPLLQRLRSLFEAQARHKGLAFEVRSDDDAPAEIETDEQRLGQVLKNLLANAVKFTASGHVHLLVRAGSDGGVRFEVRDTGLGIPQDKQQIIFEAFRQADGGTSRQFGGTGLGLSISRELVHRMGGVIEVDSTPGRGSTFSVELPAVMPQGDTAQEGAGPARAARAAAPSAPVTAVATAAPVGASPADGAPAPTVAPDEVASAPPSGRQVLLAVEDDHDFAEVLRGLIGEMGFDCVVASNGAQALELARTRRPSGVLLDVGLPDVSGLSVLERLKRDPATRHIPVHVVSATDRSPSAMAMGAIGHLVKPALREQLVEAIQRLKDRADANLRRVLVVEDDAALRQNLELLLAAPGVEIVSVGTVARALQALTEGRFDCMVTDLALPDGSGFDLLERMAKNPELPAPPVIVYTGRALSRDDEIQLRRHSRSIIVKGARSPERLLDEVTLFLHSVESSLPGEQQRLLRTARQRDAVLEGRRILLAEDDVRNIFALTSVFEPLGVQLDIARNGREALERLQRPPEVDLVLMDVMMPEMDGLTAMRHIRAMPGGDELPIIALTAKAMADDRQQCLDAGANDYLAKPIDIDRLVSLCRVWMPK
jgi:CheY-like chemotaxis protein/signal transduction histidine kinase/CHASE3 domain sensor protein